MAERKTPHDPGPLTWRENDGHYHIENVLGCVAIAFGERTSNGAVTGVVGDEGEHNARLFAASPDLLAALEQLRNAGGHSFHCGLDVGAPCTCGLDEALKVSAAAIAKAVTRG